jgi:hypothetical protein
LPQLGGELTMRPSRLLALLVLLAAFVPSPLRAQWMPGAPPERLFESERFDELEGEYARVLAARSRNRWGEFHTEEFLRRLYLSLTGAPPGPVTPSPTELDAQTLAWLHHSPKSPPAAIARANSLLLRAEAAYKANKWLTGESFTREAHALLLQVRAASKADPNWHAAWLYVAKLQGWDPQQVMAAIEEASEAEPAAAGPWLIAVPALSPDGRAPSLLVPLADLALRKSKATEGWAVYGRIYLAAARSYASVRQDPFGRGGLQWPKMNAALIDLYTRYADPYVLNQHAILACLAGEKSATAALLARIGSTPDERWWKYWGGAPLYGRCKDWAASGSTST